MLSLLLAAALGGCLSDDGTDAPAVDTPAMQTEMPEASVVVAVIDSGTTPYHDAFQRESLSDEALARYVNDGVPPRRIQLTQTGTFEERFEADKEIWEGIAPGELVYFEGTALLGVSFSGGIPVLDDPGSAHGTGTTGSVLSGNPNATVVLVEGTNSDSERWAASQPWIDIVSMSYGPTGSIPVAGSAVFGLDTAKQTHTMWGAGMIPVGASDNSPSLAPNDETAGPPWVIGVAGDHPEADARCREHVSGTFPDVTADFTQDLPKSNSIDGVNAGYSGTSFSTPMTAGVLSAALQGVREAWGHEEGIQDGALAIGPDGQTLTNEDLRSVLFRAAYYFDFGDCPVSPGTELPVNPLAPWLQMGYGHVGPEIVASMVAHILGEEQLPSPSAEAEAFQSAWMEYRTVLYEARIQLPV